MNYKMMIPPNDIGDFREISNKQAEEHFNWYVSQIPFRLIQLKEYFNVIMNANILFDNSPFSLIQIWEIFETIIETEKKTEEELKSELERYPSWLHDRLTENDFKFTVNTLAIAMDIAIYFGETIIKNNPAVHWGYFTKPKKRASVNKPVLVGFIGEQDIDPREIVLNCMRKSLRNRNSSLLLNMFNIWCNEIIK
jgi:hypothetical protein